MSTSTTWPGGAANPTPTSYSVPAAGEVNWSNLSNFLNALAGGAQGTTFQKFANRVATTSPVTVSTNDCIVICALTVPGPVAVSLPAGAAKQVFFIVDGTGDAKTNNITITPNGAETINGAASFVLNTNYQGICLSFNSGTSNWNVLLNNNSVGTNIGGFTASRAIVSDSGGFLAAATTTATEIGYVNGVTSSIQTQINTKTTNPMTTTGDVIYASNTATPATPARLGVGAANTALLSTGTLPAWGQIANANVDNAAAIAYSKLNLTGSILNADINATAAIAVSKLAALTPSRAVVTDASGFISSATTTATEIGYVNGVTSSIQTQLNTKGTNPLTTTGDIIYASNTATPATQARLGIGAASTVLNVSGGIPSWSLIANANIDSAAAIAFSKLATLSSANILVGSSGNVATSVAVTGDVTISNTGVTAIGSGVIVNADVNASAAIAGTKIDATFGSQTISNSNSTNGLTSFSPGAATSMILSVGTSQGPSIDFFKSQGTLSAKTIVQSGDSLGTITFNGYQNSSSAVGAAQITAEVDGTPGSANDMPGRLIFLTTPDGSATLVERGRISNAGLWTIGTSGGTQTHVVNGNISATGTGSFTNYLSATWTPTIANNTGSTSAPTLSNAQYIRIGNITTVTAAFNFTKNATTVDFTFDLPAAITPASNFASNGVGNGPASQVDDLEFITGQVFTKSGTKVLRVIAKYTGTTNTAQTLGVVIGFLCS